MISIVVELDSHRKMSPSHAKSQFQYTPVLLFLTMLKIYFSKYEIILWISKGNTFYIGKGNSENLEKLIQIFVDMFENQKCSTFQNRLVAF